MPFPRPLRGAAVASLLLVASACSGEPDSPSAPATPASRSADAGSGSAPPESASASSSEASSSERPSSSTPAPPPSEEELRAQAASVLMPPAVNYEDALYKLNSGAHGIFIPSWADPNLLTQPGRDIHALREQVGRDFEVAIDFEGGRVQRFAQIFGTYPSPRDMAAGRSPQEVEATAFHMGQSLASRGITVDFAPVLDVDGGGLEIVGDRAFSTDPDMAGEYGAAFARGMHNAGVEAVFKHFPGHGRASGDTHLAPAITPPLPEVDRFEMVPFHTALAGAPQAHLMMGHMAVPGLGQGQACSLNPAAYQFARERLGFEGRIYTDDIGGMKAITNNMPLNDAVVASIDSGASVALWSTGEDINWIIDTIVAAVHNGVLTPQQLAAASRYAEQEPGKRPPQP